MQKPNLQLRENSIQLGVGSRSKAVVEIKMSANKTQPRPETDQPSMKIYQNLLVYS